MAIAPVVAADPDVGEAQRSGGELDDSHDIDVVVGDDVGRVPMDEEVARPAAQHLLPRDPGVGAADPPHAGVLAPRHAVEVVGVPGDLGGGPGPVLREEVGK
jgi:hypothetical protein